MKGTHYLYIFVISLIFFSPSIVWAAQALDPHFNSARQAFSLQPHLLPNESTGAYTYDFPIVAPPGREGLEPGLSLQYSNYNRSNISPYGFGWSDNIPYIERINRTGVNNLYTSDYFFSLLDGELKASSTSGGSGYAALVEQGDFRTYEFTSSDYWIVTNKEGTVFTFGSASSSQIVDNASSTRVYRWMLEEIRDTNDNYISYEYYKDGGQLYPSKITYTGHGSTDGIFEVEFFREARTDTASSSAMGFTVDSELRIDEIRTSVDGFWVHKYELAYTTGDNSNRSLLSSITETGRSEDSATKTLPATAFSYESSQNGWTEDSSWRIPIPLIDAVTGITGNVDQGVRFADFTGDGLVDIIESPAGSTNNLFTNDGDGTWSTTTPSIPNIVEHDGQDNGVRFADFNGDALPDILTNTGKPWINTNRGGSFVEDVSWEAAPVGFIRSINGFAYPAGGRLGDFNGDGLVDVVHSHYGEGTDPNAPWRDNGFYFNTGNETWDAIATTTWAVPVEFLQEFDSAGVDNGVRFADFNGDGLTDMFRSRNIGLSSDQQRMYLNNGDGTWDALDPTGWGGRFVTDAGVDAEGFRVADVNADGFPDIISTRGASGSTVYLNNGKGTSFDADSSWGEVPADFVCETSGQGCSAGTDMGSRFVDVNGDGFLDIVNSVSEDINEGAGANKVFINNGDTTDRLSKITTTAGGTIEISYKATSEYVDGSGNLLNPELPLQLRTVEHIVEKDGFGTIATTTWEYGGGEFYYNGEHDRRFAGFATTTRTDALGNETATNFHQGNSSQTSIGENSDDFSKIGKVYRVEEYDDSNNLYRKAINKWENTGLSNGRDFVSLAQTVISDYDGDGDHKDSAIGYVYDTTNGNVTTETRYGEVSGSDNGTFTDTGTDKRSIATAFAASSTPYIVGLPKTETVKDNSGTRVAEKKSYYDGLTHGNVDIGNLTKEEHWVEGSTYIDIERVYNTFGLPTQVKDPRDKITTIVYDAHNLYPATTTDAESLKTERLFDLSRGEVATTTDPNGNVFVAVFDPLDRPLFVKIPDHLGTPSNLVTKTAWTYTDTVGSRKVQRAGHLSSATSTDTYTYFDGFDREIQSRVEAEAANQFVVTDTAYNKLGEIGTTSLPYFGTGSARTSMTTTADLLIATSFDTLGRIKTIVDTEGTETHAYDQWEEVVTDREGNNKDFHRDAFGNLVKVDEHNGMSTYTTTYALDDSDNLIKITDALGNVRNFTLDGLSRLTKNEDLHDSADGTFGSTTNKYDAASNLIETTDPTNQTVQFTVDDINRPLSEDYLGQGGTEVLFGYDSCTNGKGLLCVATTTDVITSLAYNELGDTSTETRTIDSVDYVTTYKHDRQRNITEIAYPDGTMVNYLRNSAGLLEAIAVTPAGTTTAQIVLEDINYSPTNQPAYRKFGNGVENTNTFDATALYRLDRIETIATTTGGVGGSLESLYLEDILIANEGSLLQARITDEDADLKQLMEMRDKYRTASNGSGVEVDFAKHRPEVRLKKWNNEVNLGVSYEDVKSIGLRAPQTNRVEWKGEKEEVHAYPLDPKRGMEDGGLEIEIVLNEKPKTNVFEFQIDGAENLDFFYQPEISDEKARIARDERKSFEGLTLQEVKRKIRPENVVGSYAVYHKEKSGDFSRVGGQNYKTGKAFHIYRPEVVDANGTKIWGELRYEEGTLSVSVPPDFLDTASYPAVVDPTFGYTSVGGSWEYVGLAFEGSVFTAATGTADSITMYGDTTSASTEYVTYGLYLHSDSSYVAETEEGNGNFSEEWVTLDFTSTTSISAVDYVVVAYGSEVDEGVSPTYDTGASNQGHSDWVGTYKNWADPASFTHDSDKYSIYVTYTASASNTAPIVPTALQTEGQTNPTDITDNTPEFSAIYNDPDSDDNAINYQLQVATSSSGWTSPVWDSTKTTLATTTTGNRIPDISYGGSALASSTTYYWRIKLWDDDDTEGTWSTSTASFDLTASSSVATSSLVYDDAVVNGWQDWSWDVTVDTSYATSVHNGSYALEADYTATWSGLDFHLADFDTTSFENIQFAINGGSSSGQEPNLLFYDTNGAVIKRVDIETYLPNGIEENTWNVVTVPLVDLEGNDRLINDVIFEAPVVMKIYLDEIKFMTEGAGSSTSAGEFVEVVQDISFIYDKVGNIVTITDNSSTGAGKSLQLGVDDLGRLVSASTTAASSTDFVRTFAYDAIGNFTNKSDQGNYTYGTAGYANPHAAIDINGTSLSYDNNGNLTDYGSWDYTWDYRNRLTLSGNGSASSTNQYDHENLRTRRVVGAATTTYPNRFFNVSGSTTTLHIFDDSGIVIATIEGDGTSTSTQYIHTDHLGGTNVVTDASGEVVQVLDPYPFGDQRIDIAHTDFDEQLEFTGHEYDEDSNLTYAKARYYGQDYGRFLSQDPASRDNPEQFLHDPQQFNTYSYARNNPLIFEDPNGTQAKQAISLVWRIAQGIGKAIGATETATNVATLVDSKFNPELYTQEDINKARDGLRVSAIVEGIATRATKIEKAVVDTLTGILTLVDNLYPEAYEGAYNEPESVEKNSEITEYSNSPPDNSDQSQEIDDEGE